MSLSFGTKSGSCDSLNWRIRCGCNPCARQMRCTELTLTPTALAIIAAVQWVVSPGGSPRVNATVRSCTLVGSGGMREGRVLSRSRPAIPARMNRSCQRHTVTLLVPVRRMISLVPTPSAVSSTIRARHTCFCGLFRSLTSASSCHLSAALTPTVMPLRTLAPPRPTSIPHPDSYVRFWPLGALAITSVVSNPVWADRNVIETVLPFNAIILDSCTAEQVHFTGQETYSPSSTINNNTLHLTIHDTGQIDGVGQSTGAAYRISFDTNIEQNSEIP